MPNSEHHYRRLASGVFLIVGPGLTLAGWSIFPSVDGDNAVWVADIADQPDRAATGMTLVIIGIALSMLGYMAIVHLLRDRQPFVGDVGGALTIVGTAMIGALMGLELGQVEAVRHLGDGPETVTLVDTVVGSGWLAAVWFGPILGTAGLLMLAGGLIASRSTPPLFGLLLGLGAIGQALGFFAFESLPIVVVGFAAMFVALAAIGIQLLTETDADWEEAPSYAGFHRISAA